jgi:hypothetical protein
MERGQRQDTARITTAKENKGPHAIFFVLTFTGDCPIIADQRQSTQLYGGYMEGSKRGDDKTRIRSSSPSAKKVPARYQASVVILKGYAEGMEYPIDKIHTVIGRDADVQVPLKDPLVSRQHAAILFHEGNFVLKDLDSTNGTQMNGASIKQADLRHGDKFRVGDTVLQFVLEDTGRSRTYEIA